MRSPGPMHPAAPAPTVQKQHLNVYTVMLLISGLALLIGATVLYFELAKYGSYPWWKVDSARITAWVQDGGHVLRHAAASIGGLLRLGG